jgi:hypothetical protein
VDSIGRKARPGWKVAFNFGRQMRYIVHQMANLDLAEEIRAGLGRVTLRARAVFMRVAGLLGADLKFGYGEGVVRPLL